MDSQVVQVQPEGVLRRQSVPPLLPACNKYMGGVDRTGHIRKTYGKSKHFWLSLFQFFDYAIDNRGGSRRVVRGTTSLACVPPI